MPSRTMVLNRSSNRIATLETIHWATERSPGELKRPTKWELVKARNISTRQSLNIFFVL